MKYPVILLIALTCTRAVYTEELPQPLLQPSRLAISLAASGHHPGLLLVGTQNSGLYRSVNAGASWETVWTAAGGSTAQRITNIEFDPHHPDRTYLTVHNQGNTRIQGGLFRSVDAGVSWEIVGRDILHQNARVVAFDPATPDLLYAGGDGVVFRSLDAGEHWHSLPLGVEGQVEDIVVDPASGRVYATAGHGSYSSHLLISDDEGATWIVVSEGLPPRTVVGDIEIDPVDSRVLYLEGTDGVYKSEDGGETWTHRGLDWINDIALSPDRSGLVLAGVSSLSLLYGLYITWNGGQTWNRLVDGDPFAFVFDPFDPNAIYGAILTKAENQIDWSAGIYHIGLEVSATSVQSATWGDIKLRSREHAH